MKLNNQSITLKELILEHLDDNKRYQFFYQGKIFTGVIVNNGPDYILVSQDTDPNTTDRQVLLPVEGLVVADINYGIVR